MFPCNRSREDILLVQEANLSSSKVSSWIDTLFKDILIRQDYFDWFKEVVLNSYKKSKDKKVREMNLWKVLHTKETIIAGLDILKKLHKYDLDKDLALCCFFLHDIGRFPQALRGTFDDRSSFDHGDLGAIMFREAFNDSNVVYNAIKEHNKYECGVNDLYVHLTRDADKLAILRAIFCKFSFSVKEGSRVTNKVKEQYYAQKLVDHDFAVDPLDTLVNILSFEFDMYFNETRDLYISEGIKRDLVNFIKRYDPTF